MIFYAGQEAVRSQRWRIALSIYSPHDGGRPLGAHLAITPARLNTPENGEGVGGGALTGRPSVPTKANFSARLSAPKSVENFFKNDFLRR